MRAFAWPLAQRLDVLVMWSWGEQCHSLALGAGLCSWRGTRQFVLFLYDWPYLLLLWPMELKACRAAGKDVRNFME